MLFFQKNLLANSCFHAKQSGQNIKKNRSYETFYGTLNFYKIAKLINLILIEIN